MEQLAACKQRPGILPLMHRCDLWETLSKGLGNSKYSGYKSPFCIIRRQAHQSKVG